MPNFGLNLDGREGREKKEILAADRPQGVLQASEPGDQPVVAVVVVVVANKSNLFTSELLAANMASFMRRGGQAGRQAKSKFLE